MMFKVWHDGWTDRDGADAVEAVDPEDAAESWVERHHADLDYSEEVEVNVISPDGTEAPYVVTVETVASFSAKKQNK